MELSSFSEELVEALLAAFNADGLKELMKFGMRANLDDEIDAGPLRKRVLSMIEWAERKGRLEELFAGALTRNPANRKLRAFADQIASRTIAEQQKLVGQVELLKGEELVNSPKADEARAALGTPQTSVGGLQALAVNMPHLVTQPNLLDVVKQLWDSKSRICLITVAGEPKGTGFLVGADRIMTNSHVIPSGQPLDTYHAVFDFVGDAKLPALPRCGVTQTLERSEVREFDYAIHRLSKVPDRSREFFRLASHGFAVREPVVVVGHSGGVRLSSTFGVVFDYNNQFERIAYTANTQPGGSGSPVFTQDWKLAALHHHGQTDVNNHGITMSAILKDLRDKGHADLVTIH